MMLGNEINYGEVSAWDFTAGTKDKLNHLQKSVHFVTEEEDDWARNVVPFLEKYVWIIDELQAFSDHFSKNPAIETIEYSIENSPDSCTLEQRVSLVVKPEFWADNCRKDDKGHYNVGDTMQLSRAILEDYRADRFFVDEFDYSDDLWNIMVSVKDYWE
jgi:hypothetical protein